MRNRFFKYLLFGMIAILGNGCNDSEEDLLKSKVYFEGKENRIEIADGDVLVQNLQARLSSLCNSSVDVSYEIAGKELVDQYNEKYGTEYIPFESSNVTIEKEKTVVEKGDVYAELVPMKLSNLGDVEEGKSYMLPVRIKSASIPVIDGGDIMYYIINKPVRIMRAVRFSSNYIRIPLPPGTKFSSVTYEALINVSRFGNNNTVMGREGTLILRIGDTPLVERNHLQIAGSKEYSCSQDLESGKWYHVAFTYDQPTGKTAIFINGVKASESNWDTPSFDLGTDLFVGKVAGFMWGERPFYGYMSEIRVWNVSRTENQIKQNMLTVDPKSEGLAVYYKLNGSDQYEDSGVWKVKDASGHEIDGLANGGNWGLNFSDLEEPIVIK